MATLEQVSTAPSIADYTPLSEHQSATPVQFFGAKPVLHIYSPASKLLVSRGDLAAQPLFKALHDSPATNGSNDAASSTQDEQVTVEGIDIWVTSE
jgi:nucleotide-sensitive chloride channel 1A